MAAKFKNGAWEGSLTIKGKQHELTVRMNFSDNEVHGDGATKDGTPISINGTYTDKPPYGCELTLTYTMSQNTMSLSGWRESQRGGIFGSFSSPSYGNGSFALQPSKEEDIPATSNVSMLHELEGMGFPTWVCKQALEVTNDLGAAIEMCFSLVSESGGGAQNSQGTVSATQEEIIKQLVDLGFSTDDATVAATQTNSLEEALDLVINISQK